MVLFVNTVFHIDLVTFFKNIHRFHPFSIALTLAREFAPGSRNTLYLAEAKWRDKFTGFKRGTNSVTINVSNLNQYTILSRQATGPFFLNGHSYIVFVDIFHITPEGFYLRVRLSDYTQLTKRYRRGIWNFSYSIQHPGDPTKSLGSHTQRFHLNSYPCIQWGSDLKWSTFNKALQESGKSELVVDYTVKYMLKDKTKYEVNAEAEAEAKTHAETHTETHTELPQPETPTSSP